jgi:Gas vesicle protein
MTEALPAQEDRRIALVDLLDRVLAGGVVISGEVVLSIADVDMVVISLRTLVSSVSSLMSGEQDVRGDGDELGSAF